MAHWRLLARWLFARVRRSASRRAQLRFAVDQLRVDFRRLTTRAMVRPRDAVRAGCGRAVGLVLAEANGAWRRRTGLRQRRLLSRLLVLPVLHQRVGGQRDRIATPTALAAGIARTIATTTCLTATSSDAATQPVSTAAPIHARAAVTATLSAFPAIVPIAAIAPSSTARVAA